MYIFAGYDTTSMLYNVLYENLSESTNKSLSRFVDGNLITFATNTSKLNKLSNTKDCEEFSVVFSNMVSNLNNKSRDYKKNIFIDSGGYQISIGLVQEEKLDLMLEAYTHFLLNSDNVYDRAFSLDVIPTEFNKEIDQFIELNRIGLMKHMIDRTDKITRVFHFVNPGLFNVYTKIFSEMLRETNIKDHKTFKVSVGGLVVLDKTQTILHVDPYIAAILYIIQLYKHNTGKLPEGIEFHVLGVSSTASIVKMKMIEHIVKRYFGIDLLITHDSSKIFRSIIRSRCVDYFDTVTLSLHDLDCTSKNQHRPFNNKTTNYKFFVDELQKYCDDDIDSKLDGSFYDGDKIKRLSDALMIMFESIQVKKIKTICDKAFSSCNSEMQVIDVCKEILRRMQSSQSFSLTNIQLSNTMKLMSRDVANLKQLVETMFLYTSDMKYKFLKNYRVDVL